MHEMAKAPPPVPPVAAVAQFGPQFGGSPGAVKDVSRLGRKWLKWEIPSGYVKIAIEYGHL